MSDIGIAGLYSDLKFSFKKIFAGLYFRGLQNCCSNVYLMLIIKFSGINFSGFDLS